MLLLTFLTVIAFANDPAQKPTQQELIARAQHLQRLGVIEISAGLSTMAGGFVVIAVGRGKPGEISTESQAVSDARSIGGAGLMIGGFLSALVGGDTLGKAAAVRTQSRGFMLQAMLPTGSPGLLLSARY